MFAQGTAWRPIWWINLFAIPLLSLTGRDLQYWLLQFFSREFSALLVFLALLSFSIAGLIQLRGTTRYWKWHSIWLALLFLILPFSLGNFEERIHFLLFGAFGFSSMRLYPLLSAAMWVYALSGGDELLQWWLPQRVGDWHDVYINLLAGSGGMLLAFVGRWRH